MSEIDWTLIQQLAGRPHKHLNIVEGDVYGVMLADGTFNDCSGGVGEVMEEARTVQHLCDMAGIPEGEGYDAHIDARVYKLLLERDRLAERLDRLSSWGKNQPAEDRVCGVTRRVSPDSTGRYICVLDPGHDGDHSSCPGNEESSWPRAAGSSSPESVEATNHG